MVNVKKIRTQIMRQAEAPLEFPGCSRGATQGFLETPLFLLSYLDLRRIFGKKILYVHEFSLLSTHLKYNLWINSKYDMVMFDEDLGVHLDLAMLVRREAMPGVRTPVGILTRFQGTPLGRIIGEIEFQPRSRGRSILDFRFSPWAKTARMQLMKALSTFAIRVQEMVKITTLQ